MTARRPLAVGYTLMIGSPDLDPNPGASIDFVGEHHNSDLYVLTGFADTQPGDTYVWSEASHGLLYFHPRPVPEGSTVEISPDFGPNDLFGQGFAQRLTLRYNGTDLGTQRVIVHPAMDEQAPPKFLVPAALWNRRADALLDLGFPDTVSPLEKKLNRDSRPLGFASRKITFRVVPADAAPAPSP